MVVHEDAELRRQLERLLKWHDEEWQDAPEEARRQTGRFLRLAGRCRDQFLQEFAGRVRGDGPALAAADPGGGPYLETSRRSPPRHHGKSRGLAVVRSSPYSERVAVGAYPACDRVD